MDNPFIFNGYAGARSFCDREKELEMLVNFAESGINTTLIAQRRMGKTGLIFRLMDELRNTGSAVRPIYMDIFATRDISELNKSIANAILKTFPEKSSIGKRLIRMLKGLRPVIGFDPISGAPQVQFTYQSPSEKEQTLEGLLQFLEMQNTPILLAIDEFQQIREYPEQNVEALLRTCMQRLHNVRFLFCGSKKHMMVDIFSNPQRPFFSSTQFVGLEEIPDESYASHIQKLFAQSGMEITDNAIQLILGWTRRHTYYTQRLCHDVFEHRQKKVDMEDVNSSCDRLLKLNEPYFLQYKQLLTAGQWNFLIALAKGEVITQPYANDFLKKNNIGATAVARRQLTTLIDKDLVFEETTRDGTIYRVADMFLLRWMAREYRG